MIKLAPFVCRTVPERVCQAENGFHLVFCAKVARGVTRCFLLVLSLSYSIVELLLFCNSSGLSSPREVAIVLFKGDCSQHIPSQGTAHDSREQLCLVIGCGRCGFILVRIPHRKGHSIQSVVLPASAISGQGRRIHGPTRVGPNGRDLKLPRATQIEQPVRILIRRVSLFLLCFR